MLESVNLNLPRCREKISFVVLRKGYREMYGRSEADFASVCSRKEHTFVASADFGWFLWFSENNSWVISSSISQYFHYRMKISKSFVDYPYTSRSPVRKLSSGSRTSPQTLFSPSFLKSFIFDTEHQRYD